MSDNEVEDIPVPNEKPKKEKKPRAPLTEAQKEALAKGREKRDKNRNKRRTKKDIMKNMKVISKDEESSSSSEDSFEIRPKKTKKTKGFGQSDILTHMYSELADIKKIVNKKSKPVNQTVVQYPAMPQAPVQAKSDPVYDSQQALIKSYLKV
jgi:hypothetical protein